MNFTNEMAQELLSLATGSKSFKLNSVSSFDNAKVITSKSYDLSIDNDGKMTEMVMTLRILHQDYSIYHLTLYEMPLWTGEAYQDSLRIVNKNYFERSIRNLPTVLSLIARRGFKFDDKIRMFD